MVNTKKKEMNAPVKRSREKSPSINKTWVHLLKHLRWIVIMKHSRKGLIRQPMKPDIKTGSQTLIVQFTFILHFP